ncbi:uncharacterized protein EV420DRAFT_1646619 [Desarmillaria tabescens]|uniref:Uncharacterized protein n=1 Tax=Armillaria tabescens TaxID=1929756 RepID=A0AA39JZ11_ARMTA|nr:uncharacterized protein EV420DRAFT_1646619 [Desarmillaria tabescens]KAK0450386.1 hypothetical protein EV420DRAFT_1646619 [Desarmillaria tabescens]
MSTKIYIALNIFELGTLKGKYHWAIALPRPEFNYRPDKPLDLYQSVFDDKTDSWVADHRVGPNALSTLDILEFMFLIQLPSVNTSFDEVSKFIQLEEPTQGSTPLPRERDDWSCAQGSVDDTDAYYDYICRMKGLTREVAMSAGSNNPQFVGQVVNKVRIIDRQ